MNKNLSNLIKEIKILSTNGIDENIAIVLDDNNKQGKANYDRQHAYYERNKPRLLEYFHKHYLLNKKDILQKKKEYNKLPEVKEREKTYHHNYYIQHKQELNSKNKERYKNRKNKK